MSLELGSILDEHLSELAAFFAAQTADDAEAIHRRLMWLARNPARREDVPLGWSVRDQGSMVGAMLCIPFRYTSGGSVHQFQMSSGFYVDQAHRGAGLQIFLQYRALAERFVLYATTANRESARLWKGMGARPLAGTEYELLRPVCFAGLLEEFAARRYGRSAAAAARLICAPLRSWRRRGKSSPREWLQEVDSAAAMAEPTRPGGSFRLVHDEPFCRWRYFEAPYPELRVFQFRNGGDADGFVAVNIARRGYREQLRALSIADIWGNIPAGRVPDVVDALLSHYDTGVDVMVVRCLGEDVETAAARSGFRRRYFEQPIGWVVDRHGIVPTTAQLPPAGTEML